MEKWVFKTTEVELTDDKVSVSFSKGLEDMMNGLLEKGFGVNYLKAKKVLDGDMIHITFRANIDDIELFHDALVNFYLEKYGDSGKCLLFGDTPESQS